jgi:Rha family phage regulatory protein
VSDITTLAALPPIPLTLRDGQPRVTSRDVAEIFGRRHDNVLRDIQRLDCSEGFRLLNFEESSFLNAQNKPQPMVEMTRDGFTFLAMGFTGPRAAQFKEAFIAAFNDMEAQLRGGSALPLLAETVTRMQGQLEAVLVRQEQDTLKLNALLDLVDVTKRYVGLLETNQRPPKRVPVKLTPELYREAHELFCQGVGLTGVVDLLGIGRTTAHYIRAGEYVPPPRWGMPRLPAATPSASA